MEMLWIILIVVGALILWGPIMLFFAKINKVDPYILEKSEEEITKDERSFILVSILRPLFVPLWVETKILRRFGLIKK
jgi:hypothetical protein